jgi:hypothetical protein
MKRLLAYFGALVFLLGLAAAAHAIHETMPSETMVAMPGPDAAKLSEYIIRHDPYKSWGLWPGKGELYKGSEPHGALLTTYVNYVAMGAIREKKGMGEGAIIAKENYDAGGKFVALTVMYKIKGYNPGAGDWFWAKYGPDWKVMASGRVEDCIKCHSVKKDNDFIYTGVVVGK